MSAAEQPEELARLVASHLKAGGPAGAEQALREFVQKNPGHAKAMGALAVVCQMQGKLDAAIEWIEQASAAAPDDWENHYNLGVMQAMKGEQTKAMAAYERALQLNPQAVSAHNNLGNLLQSQGRLTEAKSHFEEALRLQPDYVLAHNNAAMVQLAMGKIDEALPRLRHALTLRPDYAQAHSNILLALNSHEGYDAAALYREHLEFAQRHAEKVAKINLPPRRRVEGDRLRIGYVSADFRSHSVAFFLEKILANHDRTKFHVTCYSNVTQPDAMTQRMRGYVDQWRDIWNLSDDDAARLVARDEMDILVDLGGHTERTRLLVLARKPARIQVTYLGYPSTTGLKQIDYLITDSHVAPAEAERNYAEKVVRLPESFFCYFGPELGVPVAPPPVLNNGYITFGVLTNWVKVRPRMIDVWIKILEALPDSHLVLKANSLRDDAFAREVRELFRSRGISDHRLHIEGSTDFPTYLRLMERIDIGLDTFPFNGHTTTCHQLWMGVPVITLVGETHPSRMGLSVLSSLKLEDLAARSHEDYVDIAVKLARDPVKLQTLRAGMRQRWNESGLLDGARFTRELEAVYRQIYEQSAHRA